MKHLDDRMQCYRVDRARVLSGSGERDDQLSCLHIYDVFSGSTKAKLLQTVPSDEELDSPLNSVHRNLPLQLITIKCNNGC